MTKSPEALFAQRRIRHAQAIERNESLCDTRPTCPTALLLVLHVTKSHVAIPHIYRFLPSIFDTFLRSTHPFISFIVLLHLYTLPDIFLSRFPFLSRLSRYVRLFYVLYP